MEIKGIKYISPLLDSSGYGEASRGYVLALHKLGIPITCKPISFEKIRPVNEKYGKTLASLTNKDIDYNVVIVHATPHHFEQHKEIGKTNVGYTVWETTKLPADWVEMMNKMDMILTCCDWNVDVYKESGITVPVGNVPHGIAMDEFDGIKPYNIKGIDDDTFVFYNIFQFMERKNPTALVRAYWHAFQNNENVALVLKTYRSDYSDKDKGMVRETMKRLKGVMPMPNPHAKVYLLLDLLTRNEILGLHARGNCFVSLDRGEGFGLSGFTAGACETPVIATGFGGALEYAKPDNSYLVDYTLQPVFGMIWGPWYTGDQLWASADVHHASQLMRQVYENPDEAQEKAGRMKRYIGNNFTWEKVGEKMLKEIKSL
jgi:glycosyltransferase involved in cell wall biosynthesis